jgi:hypothetical protein
MIVSFGVGSSISNLLLGGRHTCHKELLFESLAVPAIEQQMTLVVGFFNFL